MDLYIDSVNAQRLQNDLYNLTGVRVNLYDANYRLISFFPPPCEHTPFCRCYRSTPQGFLRCTDSDLRAFEAAKREGHSIIYTCPAGMTEAISPLMHNGVIIGYIILGQFLNGTLSPEENVRQIKEKCEGIIDTSDLDDLLRQQPTLTPEQAESAFRLMEAIIMLKQLLLPQQDGLFDQITAYITAHLRENITAEQLSTQLKVTVQRIRKAILQNVSLNISSYVNMLRLEAARDLLRDCSLSISEVAEQVGFSDYNYFSRVFRKANGITPQGFRKALQGEVSPPAQTSGPHQTR